MEYFSSLLLLAELQYKLKTYTQPRHLHHINDRSISKPFYGAPVINMALVIPLGECRYP